ncbi:MAG: hypothetical protein H7Z14_20180 [Anaerolineae bacterium]|nr:hypothetical protein [Phycisphaerae bacterium]
MFEATWRTMENRAPDILNAGYGGLWTPPPSRADTGDQSVGYDVYDRFDLGSAGRPTLYGTQTGLISAIAAMHKIGTNVYVDLVWNHNGYSTLGTTDGTNTFAKAGGYPGFSIQLQNTNPNNPGYNTLGYSNVDGDFHGANEGGDINGRVAGLIDIAQEKNYQFIRNPVTPGDSRNLPAGTQSLFGRLANVPNASNAQFYPDRDLPKNTVWDARTNSFVDLYDFNSASPMAGDAVTENATGYLMRNTKWMVQQIGIDGFRIDAAKHMPTWALNYYDQSVYAASKRTLLDGSQQRIFAFSEVFDGNMGTLQQYIRKDYNTGTVGSVRGNRDDLDFPLFFAMQNNLTANGVQNDWRSVKNASLDVNDDGLANNGSQGVAFVSSHDSFGPHLSTVAYAYTLMRPGNAIVYFNAKEFGNGRAFPKDGRGDALGGMYGDRITKLVDIRNSHGRGNYADRTPTADAKEMLIYERTNSALVVLSNRMDGGFDSRTVPTGFAPGTPLLELTGNASDITFDPHNDFPEVVIVNGDGTANLRVPRNKNPDGVETGRGYLIYGPSGPQGSLSLSNVASTLAGGTPTANTNGTTRLADVKVITANSFDVTLNTNKVNLLGSIRDHDADGDKAELKIDGGIDINGNGTVDFRSTGGTSYGFENFVTTNTPGYTSADNIGTYSQSVDATTLSEGYHYITARAYRHRASGPAIFTDFTQSVYVDRLKPVSSVNSFVEWDLNANENRDVYIKSDDQTATKVQVLIDQPANKTDAEILAQLGASGSLTTQIDRDLFKFGFFNVGSGNHVFTIVTTEITGRQNVQRIFGVATSTRRGAGLGDLDFGGTYTIGDVTGTAYGMEAMVYPNAQGQTNHSFNAAADMNADGLMDSRDLYLQRTRFRAISAPAAATAASVAAVLKRGDMNNDGSTNAADIDHLHASFGNADWRYDLDVDGWPTPSGADRQDADVLIRTIFETDYGDSDLNGIVDFDDYSHIDNGFNNSNTGWANGDFDGNGIVDFDDYSLIDFVFNTQGRGLARAIAYLDGSDPSSAGMNTPSLLLVQQHREQFGPGYANSFLSAVPEPSSAFVLIGGLAASAARFRRSRHRSR